MPTRGSEKTACIVEKIARRLQDVYGEQLIPASDLERAIIETTSERLHPSDFCYNMVNKDKNSMVYPFLVQIRRGYYRYIGLNQPYDGIIYWKSKIVGLWQNGVFTMWEDPRR